MSPNIGRRKAATRHRRSALMRLGKKLKVLREAQGLTFGQLARECGLKTIRYQKVEAGRINLSISTIMHLAARLEVEVPDLLKGIF